MTTKFIKVHVECILPVPVEVRDSLDAVAEAGLAAMRDLIEAHVTTLVPGTVHTSWQSMPQSWRPKKHTIIEEEVAPGFSHLIDSEEGISFVDVTGMPDPVPTPPPTPPPPLPAPKRELTEGEEDEDA
jgi:hypothetical protein